MRRRQLDLRVLRHAQPCLLAAAADFNVAAIEEPVANLMQNWIAPFANTFGTQMVSGQLAQGFTVIQGDDGSTDFAWATWPLGQQPPHPFDVARLEPRDVREPAHRGPRTASATSSAPSRSRTPGGRSTSCLQLDGAQAVDVMLVPKAAGDEALQLYVELRPGRAAAAHAAASATSSSTGVQYQRAVPFPRVCTMS